MTAPNIGTIAASLRSCSLGGDGGAELLLPRPHLVGAGGENDAGITVELILDAALLYHRVRCHDMLVRSSPAPPPPFL
ncbi:hypothetical protein B296_00048294 [Ensete ventricosum]|uniref:Uncharacterized protein n=1 Tax=Ensete ventricosum TaxID=4639 RepID=A0A426XBW1_ENSVE|nr:hypothetical protein B296_00048294 [Ensete ventricosum]